MRRIHTEVLIVGPNSKIKLDTCECHDLVVLLRLSASRLVDELQHLSLV